MTSSPKDGTPPSPLSALTPPTRTVAIIKTHALAHRFDIEPRIQEAGFEIVKERQMEFDTEADPDFMFELFGEDVDSLAEGPVWVYVLERRRAVEVWNALMGNPDPAIAREASPNSLRALYGLSLTQNAVMGSPDSAAAEFQISTIFTSSPVFPISDLPSDSSPTRKYGSLHSLSSDVAAALRRSTSNDSGVGGSGVGYAASSGTNPSIVGGSSQGKVPFRARTLPKTHVVPDITPRTTKAAALRAGQVVLTIDKLTRATPRRPLTKEALARTFANVPGHKRSGTIPVASTAAPTIAPRMTKAAALRISKDAVAGAAGKAKHVPGPKMRPSTSSGVVNTPTRRVSDPATTFEGVPGHKRRDTISVPSVNSPPTVTPRTNRSAVLRAGKEGPPSSFNYRGSPAHHAATLSRASSQCAVSVLIPEQLTRPASAAEVLTPSRAKPRPMSLQAPAIAPRPNKSALLRAAKMENGLKNGRGSTPGQTKPLFV